MEKNYNLKRRWGDKGDFNMNRVAKGIDADSLRAMYDIGDDVSIEYVGSDIDQKCEKDEIILLFSHFWLGCSVPFRKSVSELLARWRVHPLQLSPGYWAIFARVARICKVYQNSMSSDLLFELLKPLRQNKASSKSYALGYHNHHNQNYRFYGMPSNYKNAKLYGFKIKGNWRFEDIDYPNNISGDFLKFPNKSVFSSEMIKKKFVSLFSHNADVYDLSFPDDIVDYYHDLETRLLNEPRELAPYCGSKKRKNIIVDDSSEDDEEVEGDDSEDSGQENIRKKKRNVRPKKKEKKTGDNSSKIEEEIDSRELVFCLPVHKTTDVLDIDDDDDIGGEAMTNSISGLDMEKVDDGGDTMGSASVVKINFGLPTSFGGSSIGVPTPVVGTNAGVATSADGTIAGVSSLVSTVVCTSAGLPTSVVNTDAGMLTEVSTIVGTNAGLPTSADTDAGVSTEVSTFVSADIIVGSTVPSSLPPGMSGCSTTPMLITPDVQALAIEDPELLCLDYQRSVDFGKTVNMLNSKLAEASKLGDCAKEILEAKENHKIKTSEYARLSNIWKERDLIFQENEHLRGVILRNEVVLHDYEMKMNIMKAEVSKQNQEIVVLKEQKVLSDEVAILKCEKLELSKQVCEAEGIRGDYKVLLEENAFLKKELDECHERVENFRVGCEEKDDIIEKHAVETKKSGALLREASANVGLWKSRDSEKREKLQQLSDYYTMCYRKLEDVSPSDLLGVPVPVEDSIMPQLLE